MFGDRIEAGRLLAREIPKRYLTEQTMVIGVALNGIPVACSLSIELHLPIDVVFARKIPLIGRSHLSVGAVTADGTCVLDELMMRRSNLKEYHIKPYIEETKKQLVVEMSRVRGSTVPPVVTGKTLILVDDGIATGITMQAVLRCLKKQNPQSIIISVPVSSFFGYQKLKSEVDDFIALRVCADPDFSVEKQYRSSDIDTDGAIECVNRARKARVYSLWLLLTFFQVLDFLFQL